jgi:hypothetical protein
VKQAALYRKNEPEVRSHPEFDHSQSDGHSDGEDWTLRRRLVFLVFAALASWAVVGLIGYGVYSLFV